MSLSTSTTKPLRALVVGGTSGIGQGIALALAKRGNVQVTIAGRSTQRGAAVVEQLESLSPDLEHTFVPVNGFDLSSVRNLAKDTNACDLLVMTQGMATLQGYTPTVDGLDQKLQLHYFSRIFLARLLAGQMKKGSRILTVLSAGDHGRYEHFVDDFELKQKYSIRNAADAAGFYNDAAFQALSDEHHSKQQLVVAHASPGLVNTNWGTEMPWLLRTVMIRPLQALFGTSPEECGETLTRAWLELPAGFSLLDRKGNVIADGIKHTREERDVIWEKTLKILPDI